MSEQFIPQTTELISFDLWLTLIKSNGKNFKNARNAYMGNLLAPEMPEADFSTLVRQQDKLADNLAETRSEDVLFDERVRMVAKAAEAPEPSDDMLGHLYEYQGKLFQANLPLLLEPKAPELLDQLKADYKLGVVSNTGYMHADQMRPALNAIGIGEKFDHMVFSNEVGYAKPDKRIFQALLDLAGVEAEHVTHIGDNARADVLGAQNMGMHAIHFADGVTLEGVVNGYAPWPL